MKPTKPILTSYYHDGSWWSLEIHAYDWDDARERLKKLPLAKVDGIIEMTIPEGMGWFARSYCAVRNFFGGGAHAS